MKSVNPGSNVGGTHSGQPPFIKNEPNITKPEEVFDCFLSIRMDVLVLGSTIIERI